MIFTTFLVSLLAGSVAAGPCRPSGLSTSDATDSLTTTTEPTSTESESSSTETASETSSFISDTSVETSSLSTATEITTDTSSVTTVVSTTDLTTSETSTTSSAPVALKTRTPKGTIPVGQVITSCTTPGLVALTFEGGPTEFTDNVLDLLNAVGYKGTFFVYGDNGKGDKINDYSSLIQQMVTGNHQVASSGWSPIIMAQSTPIEIQNDLVSLEDALLSIDNIQPNYMRPPFLSYTDETRKTLRDLAYKIISLDIDPMDNDPDLTSSQVVAAFEAGLDAGGSIAVLRDVNARLVNEILPGIISAVQARGLTGTTVGECLGEPKALWYPRNP
ncbi:hypothetical protein AK830_g11412 [Neonectria ditissima]|uniref:NodB homology domain-containing protein n=1 Tax=Neonectria ditissima TaxID=78410 RepID=A0A0N8H547_9HYPO|nr:hypothetical protein AK830_g11412 [Neonectria ditissima]